MTVLKKPILLLSLLLSSSLTTTTSLQISALKTRDTDSNSYIYSHQEYEDEYVIFSHNGNNNNITSVMTSMEILINNTTKNLQTLIDSDSFEIGEEASSFQFFASLRNLDYYVQVTNDLLHKGLKYQLAILNILSLLKADEVSSFERNIVFEAMHSEQLILQEYALNTISIWNDKNLILALKDIKIKNYFLQERLNIIISTVNSL